MGTGRHFWLLGLVLRCRGASRLCRISSMAKAVGHTESYGNNYVFSREKRRSTMAMHLDAARDWKRLAVVHAVIISSPSYFFHHLSLRPNLSPLSSRPGGRLEYPKSARCLAFRATFDAIEAASLLPTASCVFIPIHQSSLKGEEGCREVRRADGHATTAGRYTLISLLISRPLL
jgi:hypothetical protein